jgi:hypothetical protein
MPALSQSLEFVTYTNTASVAVVYPNSATSVMIYNSGKVQGDGYYGSSVGLHTVMITATSDFVGTASIQASLATLPAETDWFSVDNATVSYTEMNSRNTSTVDCFNFTGNFVWIRGVVAIAGGTVESILYNH